MQLKFAVHRQSKSPSTHPTHNTPYRTQDKPSETYTKCCGLDRGVGEYLYISNDNVRTTWKTDIRKLK